MGDGKYSVKASLLTGPPAASGELGRHAVEWLSRDVRIHPVLHEVYPCELFCPSVLPRLHVKNDTFKETVSRFLSSDLSRCVKMYFKLISKET